MKPSKTQIARLALIRAVVTGETLGQIASDEAAEAPDQLYREIPADPAPGAALDFSFAGVVGGR